MLITAGFWFDRPDLAAGLTALLEGLWHDPYATYPFCEAFTSFGPLAIRFPFSGLRTAFAPLFLLP